MLYDIKPILRISKYNDAFDDEIIDLIEAARLDLKLSGVSSEKAESEEDQLIRRAVTTYVKAHFGFDNPDSEKFRKSYESLKNHLTLAGDYNDVP